MPYAGVITVAICGFGFYTVLYWLAKRELRAKGSLQQAELILCWMLVTEFFKEEPHKVHLWFSTPNPLLGNISPMEMVETGRGKKLLKFIQNQLDGNRP